MPSGPLPSPSWLLRRRSICAGRTVAFGLQATRPRHLKCKYRFGVLYCSAVAILLTHLAPHWVVNEKRADGFAPLHVATLDGQASVVQLLIRLGRADVNITDVNQRTALHLAVVQQLAEIVEMLLKSGANPNRADKEGNTPLHYVMRHVTLDLLKAAVHALGATDPQGSGNSAARGEGIVEEPTAEICRLLMLYGADWTVLNDSDQTPAHLSPEAQSCDLYLNECRRQNIPVSARAVRMDPFADMVADCIKAITLNGKSKRCLVCGKNGLEAAFAPCGHVCTCMSCAELLKCCLHCRASIGRVNKIGVCVMCGGQKASTLFRSCGHCCACGDCALFMVECTVCRMKVDSVQALVFVQASETSAGGPGRLNNGRENAAIDSSELLKLRQQLQCVKDQTACPVCFDRTKNMVFLCGHGCCQLCGDRITECPMCRRRIDRKILTYQ